MKKITDFIENIPNWAGIIFIIVSLTFSSAHMAQSYGVLLPQYLMTSGLYQTGEMWGYWVYPAVGFFNWLIFELTVYLFFVFVRPYLPVLNTKRCAHIARVVFSVAEICIGAFRLLYFYYPLFIILGQFIIEFIIYTAFAYLYYLLISRRFLPNILWGRALRAMGSVYLIYNGVTVAYAIMLGLPI